MTSLTHYEGWSLVEKGSDGDFISELQVPLTFSRYQLESPCNCFHVFLLVFNVVRVCSG